MILIWHPTPRQSIAPRVTAEKDNTPATDTTATRVFSSSLPTPCQITHWWEDWTGVSPKTGIWDPGLHQFPWCLADYTSIRDLRHWAIHSLLSSQYRNCFWVIEAGPSVSGNPQLHSVVTTKGTALTLCCLPTPTYVARKTLVLQGTQRQWVVI